MLTDKDAQGCSMEFVCFPRVITDFPQVLWLLFTIQRHAWDLIKLAKGLKDLLLSSMTAQILRLGEAKENGWMEKNKVVNKSTSEC